MPELQRISSQQATDLIRIQAPLILDVRSADAFASGHIENARLISERDIPKLLKTTPHDQTVLVYCYHGNASLSIGQMLIDFGFQKVYSLDGGYEGWHLHHTPAPDGEPALTQWLNGAGFDPANLNAPDANRQTALIRACQQGRAEIVAALLEAGADPGWCDNHGNQALWAACYSGDVATLHQLIEHGVNLDHQNVNGATCLIYSASAGKPVMVRLLLEAGADPCLTTDDDFSALDLCVDRTSLKLLRAAIQKTVPQHS